MKIVFMGTAPFAVPCLKALLQAGHTVCGVITQPDKPRGRGHKTSYSPVKEYALQQGLEICQPQKVKSVEALRRIIAWNPDLITVVAYGQIIPESILTLPPCGCINVHGSLLPLYRGAAPIQRALMAGEKLTGVTTMYMDKGLDTGDIIRRAEMTIDDDIDYGELQERLAEMGAELLLLTINDIVAGTVCREPQDSGLATYAPALAGSDELICWDKPAEAIHNQIRALSPQPGAYTTIDGSKLKIYRSRVIDTTASGRPGTVTSVSTGLSVQTGQGLLELLEVQKEGRKRMPARDFAAGQRIAAGIALGS